MLTTLESSNPLDVWIGEQLIDEPPPVLGVNEVPGFLRGCIGDTIPRSDAYDLPSARRRRKRPKQLLGTCLSCVRNVLN